MKDARTMFEAHYPNWNLKRTPDGVYADPTVQSHWQSYWRGYRAAINKDVIKVVYEHPTNRKG